MQPENDNKPRDPSSPKSGLPDDEDTKTLSLDELGLTPPQRPAPAPKPAPAPQAPPAAAQPKPAAPPSAPPPAAARPAAPEQPKPAPAPSAAPATPKPAPAAPAMPAATAPAAPKPAPPKPAPAALPKPAAPSPEPTQRMEAPAAPEATARMETKAIQGQESTARWEDIKQSAMAGPGEKIIPPEKDDEPELPFSLQPDSLNESTPQVSRATSRVRKGFSAKKWIVIGVVAGIAFSATLYLHDWKVSPPPAKPQRNQLAAIKGPAGSPAPPAQWQKVGTVYFGRDEINKPWAYDPATGKTRIAPQSAADLDWGTLALVAEPPLEAMTRLAWIQAAADGAGGQLVCHDFDFHEIDKPATEGGAASTVVSWAATLPAGKYPFAPAVADTPDPNVGQLLVVASAAGELTAWNPLAPASKGPVWQVKLGAASVAAPQSRLDLRGKEGKLWLMAPTVKGLSVIDAATGKSVAEVAWPATLSENSRMAIAPMRLGDRGWGWLASNGEQAFQWTLSADGKPLLAWSAKLPDGLTGRSGAAPRLITFPDPDLPGSDQIAISSEGDAVVWLNQSMMAQASKSGAIKAISAKVNGDLAAIDLNGDGYWDLAGINSDGNIWFRSGPADKLDSGELLQFATGVSASLSSESFWRLDEKALISDYFGRDGEPEEVALELPTLTSSNIGLLRDDWDRRREVR